MQSKNLIQTLYHYSKLLCNYVARLWYRLKDNNENTAAAKTN